MNPDSLQPFHCQSSTPAPVIRIPPPTDEQIDDEMSHLTNMFSRVWRFAFGQPEQNVIPSLEDESSANPTSPSRKMMDKLNRRSMSPTSRVNSWNLDTSDDSATPIKNKNNKRKISSNQYPTPDSIDFRNHKKTKRYGPVSNDKSSSDDDVSAASIPPSPASIPETPMVDVGFPLDTRMSNIQDDTVVTEDYTPPSASKLEAMHNRRRANARERAEQGWPVEDVFLYEKLQSRGLEPLLPYHWEKDFNSVPLALFTRDDKRAFVKALGRGRENNADFRAIRALDTLINTGNRTRDRLLAKLSPEVVLKKSIHSYIQWSLQDAGLWKKQAYIPNIVVVSGNRTVEAKVLFRRTVQAVQRLETKWQTALHNTNTTAESSITLPPLYAVIITHTAMVFAAYRPDNASGDIQNSLVTIAMFNWAVEGKDVWNGFAAAILVVHCRELLLKAKEEVGEVGVVPVVEEADLDL